LGRCILSLSVLIAAIFLLSGFATSPQTDQDTLFKQAVDDFDQGHFSDAERKFRQVEAPHANEAEQYLGKIKTYGQRVQLARESLQRPADEFDMDTINSVIEEIRDAISISQNGPADTAGLLRKATDLKEQIAGRNKQKESDLCKSALDAAREDQYQKAADTVCRLAKESPGFTCNVDVASDLCREYTLRASRGEGHGGQSKLDSSDADAAKTLNNSAGSATDERTKGLRAELMGGLDRFYAGDYRAAIERLTDYTKTRGEKQTLARFYLGASKLGLYYLTGSEDTNLRQDAVKDLVVAKRAGYQPDSTVSPSILEEYRGLAF
jgi:hypothetical protein